MKNKQKGKETKDAKSAILAEAFESAGFDEEKAEKMVKQVEQVEKASELGIEIKIDLDKAKDTSADDLDAQAEFIAGTAEAVASGEISAEDAQSATENLDEVDTTVAAGPIDPKVILLNKLKTAYPEQKEKLELHKNFATEIDGLLKSIESEERRLDIFKEGVLEIFADAENQALFTNEIDEVSGDAFLNLLLDDPAYFAKVLAVLKQDSSLPPILFEELRKLNLSDSELESIFADVGNGPSEETPTTPPPGDTSLSLAQEASLVHLLQDYTGERALTPDSLDPSLFISSEQIVASVFFDDVIQAFDALRNLNSSDQDYSPAEGEILNSLDDVINETGDSASPDTGDSSSSLLPARIFGGRSISLSGGSYALGLDSSSIAASEQLNLLGNIVFEGETSDELILLSAGSVDMSDLESFTHPGSLGIGSFNSLNIDQVSLTAGDLSLHSLDSVVLNNVSLQTRSTGADFIHILAQREIDIRELSLRTREIVMSAMTINLLGVNFPDNSDVYLNSAYGGINGKYPNFGSVTQYGRVNFIENVRYGSNLINNNTSFDLHGQRISIGTLGAN